MISLLVFIAYIAVAILPPAFLYVYSAFTYNFTGLFYSFVGGLMWATFVPSYYFFGG